MNKALQHSIATFLLLVYVPVVLLVTYMHQHSETVPDTHQQIENTMDVNSVANSSTDLSCAICNFITSHSSPHTLTWDSNINSLIVVDACDYEVVQTKSAYLTAPRAPPFLV